MEVYKSTQKYRQILKFVFKKIINQSRTNGPINAHLTIAQA